jgi:hypothetical protein
MKSGRQITFHLRVYHFSFIHRLEQTTSALKFSQKLRYDLENMWRTLYTPVSGQCFSILFQNTCTGMYNVKLTEIVLRFDCRETPYLHLRKTGRRGSKSKETLKILNWELSNNIGRFVMYVGGNRRKPTLSERNGFDRESNPRPPRWPALMLISNIDLTTAPLWQPKRKLSLDLHCSEANCRQKFGNVSRSEKKFLVLIAQLGNLLS